MGGNFTRVPGPKTRYPFQYFVFAEVQHLKNTDNDKN